MMRYAIIRSVLSDHNTLIVTSDVALLQPHMPKEVRVEKDQFERNLVNLNADRPASAAQSLTTAHPYPRL
jgi:hypothetical protein